MMLSATCATGEVLRSRSYYRAEQYDSDLGLYYLRARYYNPVTGRFLSRDPEDGYIGEPATLHKYLFADGDPINRIDPTGRGALWSAAFVTEQIVIKSVPVVLAFAQDVVTAYCLVATVLSARAKIWQDDPAPFPFSPFGLGVCLARTVGSGLGYW